MNTPLRRVAHALAAATVVAGGLVLAAPSASAAPVAGVWQCTTTSAGAEFIADPQQFAPFINAPLSADVNAPVVVNVGVAAGSTPGDLTRALRPASPQGTLTNVDVRLGATVEVYQGDVNGAVNLTGPTLAEGPPSSSTPVPVTSQASGAEWIGPATVPVTLPAAPSGKRLFLRVTKVVYAWSQPGNPVEDGRTECRLISSAVPAGAGGTVVAPIVGEESWYPNAAPVPTGVATAPSPTPFAARVILTGTTTPPPPVTDTCSGSGCTTGQDVGATVNPGDLTQQATAAAGNTDSTTITLRTSGGATALTVPLVATPMTGALNPITVSDERGGTAGWSLTATLLGDITETNGGTISATAATLTGVSCAPAPGSASRIVGSGGNLSTTVSLCRVDPGIDDSQGQSGGGEYEVAGTVTVTVPAFQKSGDYVGTVQVTLT